MGTGFFTISSKSFFVHHVALASKTGIIIESACEKENSQNSREGLRKTDREDSDKGSKAGQTEVFLTTD